MSFLLSDLGLDIGDTFSSNWNVVCGNSYIGLEATVSPVPEPATMLLLGKGLIGLAGLGRKKKFKI